MFVYKVDIEVLKLHGGGACINTFGYYKDLNKAKREAKIAIENNYKKYGSREKPIVDFSGRENYLIENKAIYTEINVEE